MKLMVERICGDLISKPVKCWLYPIILMSMLLASCSKSPTTQIDLLEATDITESSATLSVSVSSQDDAISVSFFYGADKNDLSNKISVHSPSNGNYKAELSKLDFGTTYYYQATAISGGNTYMSKILSFTTKDFTPVAVDLGLSVKWATTNVGAFKEEETGYYYAWGELLPKNSCAWETYKWMQEGMDDPLKVTKYQFEDTRYGGIWYDSSKNFIGDGKTALDPEDDVASVKWGAQWRTPVWSEFEELMQKCSWKWSRVNEMNGYTVTGPNGNSIFLPAAGNQTKNAANNVGYTGSYWSGSLMWYTYSGAAFLFDSESPGTNNDFSKFTFVYARLRGHTIRPVTK